MGLNMKNFDGYNSNDARPFSSSELTCVPPLWNHPKTVGVAQAILPVRFSGTCKPLLEPVSGLHCAAGESLLKHCVFLK
jgi:hypothetical protein